MLCSKAAGAGGLMAVCRRFQRAIGQAKLHASGSAAEGKVACKLLATDAGAFVWQVC